MPLRNLYMAEGTAALGALGRKSSNGKFLKVYIRDESATSTYLVILLQNA